MGRFFCQNLSDLKKNTSSLKRDGFSAQYQVIFKQKKRSSSRLKPSFSSLYRIRFLTNSHRQYYWGEGLVQKTASKVLKTGYFAYSSGQWRELEPPLATLLTTPQNVKSHESHGKIKKHFKLVVLYLSLIL